VIFVYFFQQVRLIYSLYNSTSIAKLQYRSGAFA
jgi:hypothetical protein